MKIIKASELEYAPASHENPDSPGVWKKVLMKKDDFITGHVQMVNWSLLPKKTSFALHYHETLQEVFILMKGTVKTQVNDTTFYLSEGDGLIVDIGEHHIMTNESDEEVTYLVFGISQSEKGKTVII